MSDELALLAAILANPDEDTPRLVFADWLDEDGTGSNAARAEFIRVQCELTRSPERQPYPPAHHARLSRFMQLFNAHEKEWLGVVGVPRPRAIFRRGFVEDVRATADEVLAIGPHALAREMLSTLDVVPRLERTPQVDDTPRGDAVLRRLAEWPVRGRVRHLRMTLLTVTAAAVTAFLTSPAAAGLRSLDISGCAFPHGEMRDAIERVRPPELTNFWLTHWY
jgi:uncharacterized protein (TIGR02996 family)